MSDRAGSVVEILQAAPTVHAVYPPGYLEPEAVPKSFVARIPLRCVEANAAVVAEELVALPVDTIVGKAACDEVLPTLGFPQRNEVCCVLAVGSVHYAFPLVCIVSYECLYLCPCPNGRFGYLAAVLGKPAKIC